MLKELPPDDMFEAVAHIGRLKHEFLFTQKRPLAFESNPRKLAKALIKEGKIIPKKINPLSRRKTARPYKPGPSEFEELANLIELSELWFKYETDKTGNVTWTNKVDWAKETEARARRL